MRVSKILLLSFVIVMVISASGCITMPTWGLKKDRQEIAGEITRKEGELERHTRACMHAEVNSI